MRILCLLAAAAVATTGCTNQESVSAPRDLEVLLDPTGMAGEAVYRVTVTSLVPVGTAQSLTPPLVAVHQKPLHMFEVGEAAGVPIKEIAENGNLAPMISMLEGSRHVIDWGVLGGDPPPLMPGDSRSADFRAERGAKYLSYASMLICTNDGFTGVDGLRLPGGVGESVTVYTQAYDAGTEVNTEDFADIVPPCQLFGNPSSDDSGTGMSDPGLAEGGVIRHHDGIQGVDDLTVVDHDWENPVSMVTVERVS